MVNGVSSPRGVRVHQALHGYADGHRLLACSTSLKGRDASIMLVLSDASGPGAQIGELGYLTGYPLPETGMYALARTWAAPEMPRPGCVWTHTFLIEFADLATIENPGSFMSAFRRPTSLAADRETYQEAAQVRPDGAASPGTANDHILDFLRHLLLALYGRPRDRVVVPEPAGFEYEPWVLKVWAQQWPRLRRSFRFCTQSFADRSTDTAPFDLQLVPGRNRTAWARVPTMANSDHPAYGGLAWLDDAIADITGKGGDDLRVFLRKVGGDVAGGREAFAPLIILHGLLARASSEPAVIDQAISLLEGVHELAEARVARALAVGAAARHVEALSDSSLDFVARHLSSVEPARLDQDAIRIGGKLWARDPARLGSLLQQDGIARTAAERTIEALPKEDLLEGLHRRPELIPDILPCRPDVLAEPEFWTLEGAASSDIFRLVAADRTRLRHALEAMIRTDIDKLARIASDHLGVATIFRAIANRLDERNIEEPSKAEAAWLLAGLRDTGAVAGLLSDGAVRKRATLVAVARATYPDAVPNEYGEDPWLIAVRGVEGEASDRGRLYLAAYLLARAFGHRSRNQADLIAFSFDDVYFAALRSHLPDEAWRLVDAKLPWVPFWLHWDRCQRLRAGLADVFVDRELSPSVFSRVTVDDDLFADVAQRVARRTRGRSYLKLAHRALRAEDPQRYARRLRVIDELV